jgi:hypothetical protein
MVTSDADILLCARCESEIPKARLKALPGTMVCVACSEVVGGDFELEVRLGSTGKVGSLKLTGQTLEVRRVKKKFR